MPAISPEGFLFIKIVQYHVYCEMLEQNQRCQVKYISFFN